MKESRRPNVRFPKDFSSLVHDTYGVIQSTPDPAFPFNYGEEHSHVRRKDPRLAVETVRVAFFHKEALILAAVPFLCDVVGGQPLGRRS